MANKRISVIGLGRLGLSFALLCDSVGYDVYGYEVNTERALHIKDKTLKSSEPYIEDMLAKSNIRIAPSIKEAVRASDLIFVLVATPSLADGEYDHSQVEKVIEDIKSLFLNHVNKTVVISCTTMPGFCKSLQEKVRHLNINIIYNPEFIAQGDIINGLKHADMVLIGGDDIPKQLFELYRDIMLTPPHFNILSLTGAEITKIGINCYLTLKTAYANLIGDIAIKSGEEQNIPAILKAIGSDKRIGSRYLGYGFPASGVCLPRDVRAMINYNKTVKIGSTFVQEVIEENDRHMFFIMDNIIKKYHEQYVESEPFIFSYITYKAGVDILTESRQLELCLELLRAGYKVSIPASADSLDLPIELREFIKEGKVLFDASEGLKVN